MLLPKLRLYCDAVNADTLDFQHDSIDGIVVEAFDGEIVLDIDDVKELHEWLQGVIDVYKETNNE